MRAVILIAGQSKRFWPLQEKALWCIGGKTLIEHQIEKLKEAGIDDVLLVGGEHNLEMIQSQLPAVSICKQKDLSLGMQGALLSSLPDLPDEPLLVVSSNDIIDVSAYKELLKTMKGKGDGALLAKRVTSYFPGGYLTVEKDRITSIMEKPGEGKEPSDLVNIVAHIHRSPKKLLSVLSSISSKRDDGYEQALDSLFKSGVYSAVPYEKSWQAVKFPWHLLGLLPIMLPTKAKTGTSVEIHPTAVIDGPVVLEDGVKVMAHATVKGPCYIGKDSVIANNALIRDSSIGSHSVIGFGTEVARSIIGNHVWTHSSYVGDSIIDDNVSLGAGTVTANLRLDEEAIASHHGDERLSTNLTKFGAVIGKHSRIGVHVTLAPGIKIGGGTFIESASYVTQDLPENSFAKMKQGELDIRENSQKAPDAGGRKRP